MKSILVSLMSGVFLLASPAGAEEIRVGSKAFTEGYLLAELASQAIEKKTGRGVARKFGLGNTGVAFEALLKGEIDVYPEYTGTIAEAILRDPNAKTRDELMKRLESRGLVMSPSLGFNNTYALAVSREFANRHGLESISDLGRVKMMRSAFSHEFVSRADGLAALQKRYRIDFGTDRQSLEHSLAYAAIASGKVDVIDVYSTDAQIDRLDLVVLADDLGFFPRYEGVFLARRDFVDSQPDAWAALVALGGELDESRVRKMNSRVEVDKLTVPAAIAEWFRADEPGIEIAGASVAERVWRRTKEHAFLVLVALIAAFAIGLPLGILAARRERVGQVLLLGSSVIQTIPSLALLCLLIPVFGIGTVPALVALFLYSLLPIIMNTYVGLRSIDLRLVETARALGLSSWQRTMWIELPLASRSIVAGVKTSAIIGIGTATLAALIGAGGYGAPIVSGLAMNDTGTVLIGAVPAAVMSLIVHFSFEIATRFLVPRGLR